MNKYKKIVFVLVFFALSLGTVVVYQHLNKSRTAKDFEIVYTNDGFVPQDIVITKKDRVIFKNNSDRPFWPASDPHPLHSIYPQFDPKRPIESGESWAFIFPKTGEWKFHDHLFPVNRGIVNVLDPKDVKDPAMALKRDEVEKLIEKKGVENAYKHLKTIYDPATAAAHSTFHLFGEVLYQKFSVNGIEYCDGFAGFGCYHGHFIKAVAEKGVEIAIELDKVCLAKFGEKGLGCPHGIGHGLLEYFGHGKITEALEICKKLTWKGPLFGCSGGVFMENNFPTVFEKDGARRVSTREAHGNLFQPCIDAPVGYKQACYFEQASWWNDVLKRDSQKIGNFCNSLKDQSENESCLLGAGNSIAEISEYNANEVAQYCKSVPGNKSIALCRAGAAWAFFANPAKREISKTLCQGLGNFEDLCLSKMMIVK